jgi:hypothetical protein
MMNENKQQLNMYPQNMMNMQIVAHRTYCSFPDEVAAVTLLMTTLEKTGQSTLR